jgi:ribosomal protein S18 acetylase RimI-like enzyme
VSNIRIATLADSKSINSLSMHLGYGSTPQEVADERLRCVLKSTNDKVWVFEESDIILGWVHIFKAHRVASGMFYEIGGLVVDPEARNKGVGRKLVEFAAEESETENIELRVRCNSQRKDTHEFYKKLCFSSSKTQIVFKMCL